LRFLKLAVASLGVQPKNQAYYHQNGRGNEDYLGGVVVASAAFPATFLLAHFASPDSRGRTFPFDASRFSASVYPSENSIQHESRLPDGGLLFLEVKVLGKVKNTDFDDPIEVFTETPLDVTPTPEMPRVQEKLQRLVYVGPNVPGGILQRFQVFKGGLPPHCKDLLEKVPEIKELFVPVEGLEAMRRKIGEPGTNEARLFYVVQKNLAKGVK
jgi:hypothetical protein